MAYHTGFGNCTTTLAYVVIGLTPSLIIPTLHSGISLISSIFRYISNSTEKCISHSIVFTCDHWHPTPHCGRSWWFRGETERRTL
jgi:hypothetical protein